MFVLKDFFSDHFNRQTLLKFNKAPEFKVWKIVKMVKIKFLLHTSLHFNLFSVYVNFLKHKMGALSTARTESSLSDKYVPVYVCVGLWVSLKEECWWDMKRSQ